MAVPALAAFEETTPISGAEALLDAVEQSLHSSQSEWLFLRELRVGTGRRNGAAQRLDGFALNCFPHRGLKRVCYEVKTSRADFLNELKQPLKRRIGMRYSNEFYFVTPPGLASLNEIPAECGLIEVGRASVEEWRILIRRHGGFYYLNPASRIYCMVIAPAPWRDSPGPTWELTAAMLRNQRRVLELNPPVRVQQQRLSFG